MIPVLILLAALNPLYLRVELLPNTPAAPPTFWEQITHLLGGRRLAKGTLPVGTKLIVQATGYAPSPYQTDGSPCRTAVGTQVRRGVVASNYLPIGTLLEITSEDGPSEQFIVEDAMNSRYDRNYLDIWFPATSDALEFGRRKLEITIVGYGEPGQELVNATPTPTAQTEVTIRTEEDLKPIVRGVVKSWWRRIIDRIGARITGDVNRFDIGCTHL